MFLLNYLIWYVELIDEAEIQKHPHRHFVGLLVGKSHIIELIAAMQLYET